MSIREYSVYAYTVYTRTVCIHEYSVYADTLYTCTQFGVCEDVCECIGAHSLHAMFIKRRKRKSTTTIDRHVGMVWHGRYGMHKMRKCKLKCGLCT